MHLYRLWLCRQWLRRSIRRISECSIPFSQYSHPQAPQRMYSPPPRTPGGSPHLSLLKQMMPMAQSPLIWLSKHPPITDGRCMAGTNQNNARCITLPRTHGKSIFCIMGHLYNMQGICDVKWEKWIKWGLRSCHEKYGLLQFSDNIPS